MTTTTSQKTDIISKIDSIINQSGFAYNKWKIGAASIQRLTLIQVKNEVHYFPEEAINANEIIFSFIAQGVQVCKMSKIHSEGIYLYR